MKPNPLSIVGRSWLVVAIAVLLIPLGCESGEKGYSGQDRAQAEAEPTESEPSGGGDGESGGGDEATSEERLVIRNASLTLEADDPDEASEAAGEVVAEHGGHVDSAQSRRTGQGLRNVDMTLRVASDDLDPVLEKLKELGEVVYASTDSEDVTDKYRDLEARLNNQRALEERYLGHLEESADMDQTLKVEEELTRVRTEIERLEGKLKSLDNRISMSRIKLTIRPPEEASEAARSGPSLLDEIGDAFSDGYEGFVTVTGGIIRFLIAIIPVVVVLTVFALLVRLWWRRRKARRAEEDDAEDEEDTVVAAADGEVSE
ncbi:MAG: DUF4349 domain-containing protein [Persicimonas sp.]